MNGEQASLCRLDGTPSDSNHKSSRLLLLLSRPGWEMFVTSHNITDAPLTQGRRDGRKELDGWMEGGGGDGKRNIKPKIEQYIMSEERGSNRGQTHGEDENR